MSSKALWWVLLPSLACSGTPDCRKTLTCGEQGVPSSDESLNGDSDGGIQDGDDSGAASAGMQGSNSGSGGSDGLDGGGGGSDGNGGSSGTASDGGAGSDGGVDAGADGNDGTDHDGATGDMHCGTTPETGCTPLEQGGVFVDASAADGGDGSLASPANSIADALTIAKDNAATDIYICAGNYDESVHITDAESGIDLHGGFNCSSFAYDATAIPVVSPSTGEYALHITGLESAILIEDIAFTAIDADDPGESSIAAFVAESTSVTFDRCQFTAGNGISGDDGITDDFIENNSAQNWPMFTLLLGDSAGGLIGGMQTAQITCPGTGGVTRGGKGGDGGGTPQDGTAGSPAPPIGGTGGTATQCAGSLRNGAPGNAGNDGDGAPIGTLEASGWTPGAGTDGEVGAPGGGGGGGGGDTDGGGGGGGAGGCGGNLGPGGQGGGASIALLAHDSTVTVLASTLTSADSGNGGNGDTGQQGQRSPVDPTRGGRGGSGANSGCDGGNGGIGGDGGNGGGGAGGISAGILWSGATAPVIDQATTDAITVGTEGAAGTGAGVDNDGAAGFAVAVYAL